MYTIDLAQAINADRHRAAAAARRHADPSCPADAPWWRTLAALLRDRTRRVPVPEQAPSWTQAAGRYAAAGSSSGC